MKRLLIAGTVLTLLLCSVVAARTWTDSTGKFTIEGEFGGFKNGKVLIKTAKGELAIPRSKLSAADQKFVVEALKAAKNQQPDAQPAGSGAAPGGSDTTAWPTWRGPSRDGASRETGLLQQWPEQGPPLDWSTRGLGSGFSSVSIAGGRIFTLGQKENATHIVALKESDGSLLWSTPIGKSDKPNCTPTVDGDLVYGMSFSGELAACNVETGKVVWSKHMKNDFGGKMMSGWGYSESPLIDGDLLICTPGGPRAMLVALNKKTGETVWTTIMPNGGQRGQDGAGYSSVVISNGGGVKQYVQLVGRGLIGVRASNGELLWRYDRIANGTANIPTPIISGDLIFCSTGYGDGGSALLKLVGRGKAVQVQELRYYSAKELQNHHGGMVLVDDHIYFGHGHNNGFPVCVELKSGNIIWGKQRGEGARSAAVVYADGHMYFRYEDGVMVLMDASPKGYNVNGKFTIKTRNDTSWPHPVVHHKHLYLRDGDELHRYNVAAVN